MDKVLRHYLNLMDSSNNATRVTPRFPHSFPHTNTNASGCWGAYLNVVVQLWDKPDGGAHLRQAADDVATKASQSRCRQ
jgi:hypothetical protein